MTRTLRVSMLQRLIRRSFGYRFLSRVGILYRNSLWSNRTSHGYLRKMLEGVAKKYAVHDLPATVAELGTLARITRLSAASCVRRDLQCRDGNCG